MSSPKTDSKDGEKVHSANSWETADLGDESRNQKFLRLMGANKKEHHGRFVIGDQEAPSHKRPKEDEKHIAEELSEQYAQGMEHRLIGGKKGHLGLGYHPEKTEIEEAADREADKEADAEEEEAGKVEDPEKEEGDDTDKEKDGDESSPKKEERKREAEEDESEHDVKKLKFVKSTS